MRKLYKLRTGLILLISEFTIKCDVSDLWKPKKPGLHILMCGSGGVGPCDLCLLILMIIYPFAGLAELPVLSLSWNTLNHSILRIRGVTVGTAITF